MKKIILLFSLLVPFSFAYYGSSCSEFGFMAYESSPWYCKCMSWYVMRDGIFGSTCVSMDSACRDDYGVMANYDSLSGKCSCTRWWVFWKDVMWKLSCISWSNYCSKQLWYWSEYDSLSWDCKCSSGYTLGKDMFGEYQCMMCSSVYGIHSKYSYLKNACVCNDGYTLNSDSGKCEEKSYSAYFLLVKYDEVADKVLVYSSYTHDYYVLELRYAVGMYKIEDFVGKNIVINLGTDQKVNRWDKFVLNNETKTTDIVIDIQSVEDANDEYALDTCEDIYWDHTIDIGDKCYCESWYEWNTSKTNCIYKGSVISSQNNQTAIITAPQINYYDSTEALNNANHLAGLGIIAKVDNVSDYNLNWTILRQEIIWIALKLKSISLQEDYTCKWLYKDVSSKKPNNWVCRVAEVASENGIVSKENAYFRPEGKVTLSEWLAMVFNALGTDYNVDIAGTDLFYPSTVDWQKKVLKHAKNLWLIESFSSANPNENVLRWQIFNFISRLLK